jgi:hypothetical protein
MNTRHAQEIEKVVGAACVTKHVLYKRICPMDAEVVGYKVMQWQRGGCGGASHSRRTTADPSIVAES